MTSISDENVDEYQAEFDAMILGLYDAFDEIERKTDELLEEVSKTVEEGRKLVQKVNSINLRFSQKASSSLQPSIDDGTGQPRMEDNAIIRARFQSLTEKVQDGKATPNERNEFEMLRRWLFSESEQSGSNALG